MAERAKRKEFTGEIVSNKMEKTIVVKVTRKVQHPLYKKYIKKSNKFMVHCENNKCSIGDIVKIAETRPLSRHKRWRLVEVIKQAK
ncbi:MAG: 30S ribosomal protein S17 [bacterium]